MLEIETLNVRYGRNHAVRDVSLSVAEGEIVTVLGANGAGKSSLLKAIQGTVSSNSKGARFQGKDLPSLSPQKRVSSGLVLVPEGRQIFVSMTVHENLLMGAYCRRDTEVAADIEGVYERFPNLAQRRDLPASVLSGGEQQMLAISRALLARPSLMMLDEPSLGLSPILVNQLFDLIASLNQDGLSILLVEQNTHKALQTASRGYVLELGRVVVEGTPDQLRSGDQLEAAYLGAG
ncbi:MAG: ABC transporter ATP-binding protein [Alphaproteobacteria bacterium]